MFKLSKSGWTIVMYLYVGKIAEIGGEIEI